jgi:RNA polymerase sigma factor (sigma-70 family)
MELERDRALLDAFRRGDRAALESVYRAYAPIVGTMLRAGFSFDRAGKRCRFLGVRSEFDFEDRLHEVFTRAFSESGRTGYNGVTSYAAYLQGITKNLIIDHFRKRERILAEYSVEELEPAAIPNEGASEPLFGQLESTGHPELDAEAGELLSLVAEFRGGLGVRDRQVFQLRFEQEQEHKEIEAATGLSASKIKTSEKRIRTDFFQFLRRHGYFNGYTQERQGWLKLLNKLGVGS